MLCRHVATPGSAASVTSRLARTHLDGQYDDNAEEDQSISLADEHARSPSRRDAEHCSAISALDKSCSSRPTDVSASGHSARAFEPVSRAEGARAAKLHAVLLSRAPDVPLEAEVELLLRLVAVPAEVSVASSPDKEQPLFPDGQAAASYACAVLQDAGDPFVCFAIQQMIPE